jgi:H+/Cl- antiporter ClcA
MRKAAALMFGAILATAFAIAFQSQIQLAASPLQTGSPSTLPDEPSPLLVAAVIVGLVALAGAILSLLLRRRSIKRSVRSQAASPRWWIKD